MAGLRESHAGTHSLLLRGDIGLAHLTTLVRKAAKNQRLRTKLRTPALFNCYPEAGNHAKMQNHRVLAEGTSSSLEHGF
jgi:hypothetical protein